MKIKKDPDKALRKKIIRILVYPYSFDGRIEAIMKLIKEENENTDR